MARLVAVCREGEEDYPFLVRQIPLYIDDTLTVRKLDHREKVYEDPRCEVANSIISLFGSGVLHISSLTDLIQSRSKSLVITKH